jgi:ATP-dependent DNA ligase
LCQLRSAGPGWVCHPITCFDTRGDATKGGVLDGELAFLDDAGRPQFLDSMFGRGTPTFVAFDLLAVNGRDVRGHVLLQRKRLFRRLVPKQSDGRSPFMKIKYRA